MSSVGTDIALYESPRHDLMDVVGGITINPIWFQDLNPMPSMGIGLPAVDAVGRLASTPDADEIQLDETSTPKTSWIVQIAPHALDATVSVANVADMLEIDTLGGRVVRGLGLEGMVLVETDGTVTDDATVRAALTSLDAVQYFEVDRPVSIDQFPDDTRFNDLWALHNPSDGSGSIDTDIDAPEAWQITPYGDSVVVGVIDTGIDYNHVDLAINMWTNPGEIANNDIDDDGNGFIDDIHGYDFFNNDGDPFDDHGHGTHVAGTIGAVGDNGLGVTGIGWTASLMALKFLGSNGNGSTSNAVRAVNYATMMRTQFGTNVRVTNNSWGGGESYLPLQTAIEQSRRADMLFIAAAGNDGKDIDDASHYPSSYPSDNLIAVAATNRRGHLASFSNFGLQSVDLAAPGVSILSTMPGNRYAKSSGTSMATPHVAGTAGLAWSLLPNASYAQVRDALFNGVDRLLSLEDKVATSGRLNARGTLEAMGFGDPAPAPIPVSPRLPDLYESDDSANQATPLTSNTPPQHHGLHDNHDIDWYHLEVSTRSNISIFTEGSVGGTSMQLLHDIDGNRTPDNIISYNDDGGSGSFSKIARLGDHALAPGSYFVRVQQDTDLGPAEHYAITVIASVEPNTDIFEADNTPGQASSIDTNGVTRVHSIHQPSDVDWSTFTLDMRSDIIIETAGPSGDIRMWLYGPGNTSTLVGYSNGQDGTSLARIERRGDSALEKGTYFIRICESGRDATIPMYTLSVNATVAAADLAMTAPTYTHGTYTIGDPIVVEGVVVNQGRTNVGIPETFAVEIRLSLDEQWGNTDDIVVGRQWLQGPLPSNARMEMTVTGEIPAGTPEGRYWLMAYADASGAIDEVHEANNIWQSASADVAISPVRVLSIGGREKARFTDSHGETTTVTLRGVGGGNVLVHNNGVIDIMVSGTSIHSVLHISSPRHGSAVVRNISVDGSLRALLARRVDLAGALNVSGGMRRLLLDDLHAGATIDIGANSLIPEMTVRLSDVTDARFASASMIRTFRINTWQDTDETPDTVTASSVGVLRVRGDFESDLQIDGAVHNTRLSVMRVGGRLRQSTIHAASDVGVIVVGSMQESSIFIDGKLGHMVIRNELTGSMLQTRGDLAVMIAGRVDNATIDIGGSMRHAIVRTAISATEITVGGDAGIFSTPALAQTSVHIGGSLRGVVASDGLFHTVLHAAGNIGIVVANRLHDSTVQAGAFPNPSKLPDDSDMSLDPSTIRLVRIGNGRSHDTSAMVRSHIIASDIRIVFLLGVYGSTGDQPFGIVADTIRAYQRTGLATAVRLVFLDEPGTVDTDGALIIRIV